MMPGGAITDHAVVRFLERHDGVPLGPFRLALSRTLGCPVDDRQTLAALAQAGLIDPAAVRQRMMTPQLAAALAAGASGLRFGRYRYVIIAGRVATVRLIAWDRRNRRNAGRNVDGEGPRDRRPEARMRQMMAAAI